MNVYFMSRAKSLTGLTGVRQKGGLPGPPVVPRLESIAAQAAFPEALLPGWLRPELFPGIGVLPGPATRSHIVNRGTPAAPLGQAQLNVPEKRSHPRGPSSPDFPKSPIAAGPRKTHGHGHCLGDFEALTASVGFKVSVPCQVDSVTLNIINTRHTLPV